MRITELCVHEPIGLLRIRTESALEGHCFGIEPGMGREIVDKYGHALIDQDPIDRERLWLKLLSLRGDTRDYASIDCALWDLASKISSVPVRRMIGGFRDRVPTFLRGVSRQGGADSEAVSAKEEGYLGYMIRGQASERETAELVRAARSAVGPEFNLMVDCARGYSEEEAIHMGKVFDDCAVYWFQEPVSSSASNVTVAAAVDTPLAITVEETREASQILSAEMSDYVMASTPSSGGITDMLKISRTAEAFGVFILIEGTGICHGFVHAHLFGATKNAPMFEAPGSGPIDETPFIANPLTIENGMIDIPSEPGLGLKLNWDAISSQTDQIETS